MNVDEFKHLIDQRAYHRIKYFGMIERGRKFFQVK